MKYAIYDKATNAYLTKMIFDVGYSDNTQFNCEITEYITNARLLSTKEAADNVVADTESFKFMEKGRFVVHSFDDTLNDQYIISEAGNPTKVVDNITVDLCGTINVKYGTMMLHWSATSLNDVIDRMNSLQKAASAIYTSWNVTFGIYKVINIIDEKGHTHYQFMNVTAEGLEKYSKDEKEKLLVVGKELTDITDPLNKRIEELEKANCVLTDRVNYHNEHRVTLANVIRAIKYAIYNYKDNNKCANYISYMTDKIKNDEVFNHPELKTTKNDISKICKHLTILSKDSSNKRIEELEKANYELGEQVAERGTIANRLLDENNSLKAKVEDLEKAFDYQKKLNDSNKATIAQMVNVKRAMNKELSDAADALKEVNDKNDALSDMLREITDYVGDIMLATRTVDRDKMISDLRSISCKMGAKTADDGPIYGISIILNTLIVNAKEVTDWKNHADKFTSIRNSLAEVIFAIRNAIYHNDSDAFCCIENRMKIDPDFNSGSIMAGVREDIKDICSAEKRNVANHELKDGEIAKLAEKIEKLKSQFNSMYGYYDTDGAAIDYCLHDIMITGGRCCGKQLMADILSGKKIPISKDKYDSILTTLKLIDLSYEGVYGTTIRISPKPKPTWLPGLMTEIKNLTK